MKEEVQKLIDQLKELIQKEGIDPEEVVRQLVPRPEPEEMEIDPERIAAEDVERAVGATKKRWIFALLAYAFVASVLPVWEW